MDKEALIFANINIHKEEMNSLLERINHMWGEEDKIYRFYHESFKVYDLQQYTTEMFNFILKIGGIKSSRDLNAYFVQIIHEGTDKQFNTSHNTRWMYETRPILEAFWHAKHILEMMLKYGSAIEDQSRTLDSGWATVLSIYKIR